MVDKDRYGPWALIAGGSEGIGACIAHDLAKAGINLVLIARKPGPLEELAATIRQEHDVAIRTQGLDLTSSTMLDEIRKVTDDIEVGLLVYNAGASHRTGPFLEWPIEDVRRVIRLNVDGQTELAHHFGRKMVARGRGGIILMGSVAGNAGSPSVVPYSGAKAFSQIFSEGLWCELRNRGVDVLHVIIGATWTPAMERLGVDYPKADDSDYVARLTLENIAKGPVLVMPLIDDRYRRLCTPDRAAATLTSAGLVLSSTESTFAEPDRKLNDGSA